jgi:hypothetical protein
MPGERASGLIWSVSCSRLSLRSGKRAVLSADDGLEGRPDVYSGKSMAPTTRTCLFSPPDGSWDLNVAGEFHVEPWPSGRPVSLKSTAVSSSIGFDLTGGTLSHSYHP